MGNTEWYQPTTKHNKVEIVHIILGMYYDYLRTSIWCKVCYWSEWSGNHNQYQIESIMNTMQPACRLHSCAWQMLCMNHELICKGVANDQRQYIPQNMHMVCWAFFIFVISFIGGLRQLINPFSSGLLGWHWAIVWLDQSIVGWCIVL